MEQARNDQSFGALFGRLSQESLTLMRQEVEFAKVEMTEKASRAAKRSILLAVGGSIAFVGFQVLVLAVIIALSKIFTPLISAIIVGVVLANTGFILLAIGYVQLKDEDFSPRRTISLMNEEAERLEGHPHTAHAHAQS